MNRPKPPILPLDKSPYHFAEVEEEAWRLSQGLWASAVAKLLEWRRGDVENTFRCSQCGAEPQHKGTQERSQETLVGRVQWRRGYYYCARCRRGYYPLDEAWGVAAGEFSEGVQKKVSRLAARMPFAPAAEEFAQLTGVHVSNREVMRLAEKRGAALEQQLTTEVEKTFAQGETIASYPAQPLTKGAWGVALDAGKVHLLDGWHDVDVGTVFRPTVRQGEVHCDTPSYVAKITSMEETGQRLYVEGCKRGLEASQERVICVGDGAPANWKQFAVHFPQRVEILDWYHVMEHVWSVAHGLYGEGSAEATAWAKAQEKALWEGQPHRVVQVLRALAEEPSGQAAAAELHYFETNQGRMYYDRYRAAGYPMASGTAESACKQVVGARLKQAGMRWSKEGAQAILNLRAALLSDLWDEAWTHTCSPPHVA